MGCSSDHMMATSRRYLPWMTRATRLIHRALGNLVNERLGMPCDCLTSSPWSSRCFLWPRSANDIHFTSGRSYDVTCWLPPTPAQLILCWSSVWAYKRGSTAELVTFINTHRKRDTSRCEIQRTTQWRSAALCSRLSCYAYSSNVFTLCRLRAPRQMYYSCLLMIKVWSADMVCVPG